MLKIDTLDMLQIYTLDMLKINTLDMLNIYSRHTERALAENRVVDV